MLGMQPIPVADLPILLTLQSLMVGLIIHIDHKNSLGLVIFFD